MMKREKTEKLTELKKLIHDFCVRYLNDEYEGYAVNLCERLGKKRTVDMTRGKTEIWAAAIVYEIARLNFLFGDDNDLENPLSADVICNFFNTKKTTTGNKASLIEKSCGIRMGEEGLCHPEITEMLTCVRTPEGFVFPLSYFKNHEIVIEIANEEETEELEKVIAERKRRKEQIISERNARREENKRQKAEEKRRKQFKDQLNLFDD